MQDYQEVDLRAEDGVNIKGYFIRYSKPWSAYIHHLQEISTSSKLDSCLLSCECWKYGPPVRFDWLAASNDSIRLPIARYLHDKLGCNVFMLSYRGYGLSEVKS